MDRWIDYEDDDEDEGEWSLACELAADHPKGNPSSGLKARNVIAWAEASIASGGPGNLFPKISEG